MEIVNISNFYSPLYQVLHIFFLQFFAKLAEKKKVKNNLVYFAHFGLNYFSFTQELDNSKCFKKLEIDHSAIFSLVERQRPAHRRGFN